MPFTNTVETYHTRSTKQSHATDPIRMGAVARLIALQFRRQQIDRSRDDQIQPVDLPLRCALVPVRGQFSQNRFGHQIDMPACVQSNSLPMSVS
jgi:hypothetical protein